MTHLISFRGLAARWAIPKPHLLMAVCTGRIAPPLVLDGAAYWSLPYILLLESMP